MHGLLQILLHNQNQFASGGLLLMAIGAVGASLRRVPTTIWYWMVNQFTLQMTVTDESDMYPWVKRWYTQQGHSKKSRRVDLTTVAGSKSAFTAAPGTHWFWYKGRPLVIVFSRTEDKKQATYASNKRSEAFTIRTIGRSQKYIRLLADDFEDCYKITKNKPTLSIWSDDGWSTANGYFPRPLESVILPEEQKNRIINDIKQFLADEDWYHQMGIPYHRGYLLHGPPGTGKTSLVTGLSSYFKSKVYILKLSEMTDSWLATSVLECEAGSFIVLEDIDCIFNNRKKISDKDDRDDKLQKFVTLSGLLNVLDGMQAPERVMFFMTTNHIEKLDEALQRPGRVDLKEYIGKATEQQKAGLFRRFFPQSNESELQEFLRENETTSTMAEIQNNLMKIRRDKH